MNMIKHGRVATITPKTDNVIYELSLRVGAILSKSLKSHWLHKRRMLYLERGSAYQVANVWWGTNSWLGAPSKDLYSHLFVQNLTIVFGAPLTLLVMRIVWRCGIHLIRDSQQKDIWPNWSKKWGGIRTRWKRSNNTLQCPSEKANTKDTSMHQLLQCPSANTNTKHTSCPSAKTNTKYTLMFGANTNTKYISMHK